MQRRFPMSGAPRLLVVLLADADEIEWYWRMTSHRQLAMQ